MSLNHICNGLPVSFNVPINSSIDNIDYVNFPRQSNTIRRDALILEQTGGAGQPTYSALNVISSSNPDNTTNEWTTVSTQNNLCNDSKVENVALYARMSKQGDSKSWGATIEATEDKHYPNSSLVGLEVDLFSNGGDKTVSQKVALDIVIGKSDPAGLPIQPFCGLCVRNNGSYSTNGNNAIHVEPNSDGNIGNTWSKAIMLYDKAKIAFTENPVTKDALSYITFDDASKKFQFFVDGVLVRIIP